jgi:hypothetical protein
VRVALQLVCPVDRAGPRRRNEFVDGVVSVNCLPCVPRRFSAADFGHGAQLIAGLLTAAWKRD